jgi:hypothetical protein
MFDKMEPASHDSQSEEPKVLNFPAEHSKDSVLPKPDAKRPRSHAVHAGAICSLMYLPGAHEMHEEVPSFG